MTLIKNIVLKRLPIITVFVCIYSLSHAQQESEERLKAVFIYNFTKYIEWEPGTGETDFVIGIIGQSPVSNALSTISMTNTVNNKRIVIRIFNSPEEISVCNILFISQKLPFPLHKILEHTGKGTLTISEEPGGAKEGTAFNFVIVNDKLRFESNLKALSAAGLKASSELLKLAIIVN